MAQLIGPERVRRLARDAQELRGLLGKAAIWSINSTSAGGGVAEMLRSYLRYARGEDIDARWLVLEAPPEFFRLTKRLHGALQASRSDASPLGPEQSAIYEQALATNTVTLDTLVRPGDLVICHDPQTAGLVPHLLKLGAK
ncbi:MAG TPA: hypothetical protein VMI75_29565, partial [Polyangiaceae bacterium]|nr:hypothetical protein [Polyangiaceae bacterium]